jgi:hypothetical protein
MKYLLLIASVLVINVCYGQRDTILSLSSAAKWLSSGTTINGVGIISLPQYDTVDVICLVSDTTESDFQVISNPEGMIPVSLALTIKAKAVRENKPYIGSPDPVDLGNGLSFTYSVAVKKDNWEIIKYIGIPSRYIIWQTKILK